MTWPVVKLGSVVETIVPQRDKPSDLTGPIPWVRIEDFSGQYISTSKSQQGVTREQVRAMNLRVFPAGTVLCSCSCTMGATAIARNPVISNQTFIGLRPRDEVDSRYLYYLMGSMRENLQAQATGAIQQYLSRDDFRSMRVSLPPLEEQRRIADFLDVEVGRIDKLVQKSSSVKSVLRERRALNIELAVSGVGDDAGVVESTIPWVRSIREYWKEVKVNFVARMGSGHTPSRSVSEWWVDPTVPWITTGEVAQIRDDRREVIEHTREKITRIGIANSSATIHPAGTVVLSRTASAGFSAVMGYDMATSQDFVTWTCGSSLNPYYLLWCLRAMRPYLLGQLATGSTHKTIYVPDLQGLRIPLPPIEEQVNIVQNIRKANEEVDQLCDRLDEQRDLLAERKQALITAAVTGKIDVATAGRATADLRA